MANIGDAVGRNVRVERVRRRWRQADLAEHLGWSMTKVSDIEAGKRRVGADQLVELCAAFQISLVRLLDEADPEDLRIPGIGRRASRHHPRMPASGRIALRGGLPADRSGRRRPVRPDLAEVADGVIGDRPSVRKSGLLQQAGHVLLGRPG